MQGDSRQDAGCQRAEWQVQHAGGRVWGSGCKMRGVCRVTTTRLQVVRFRGQWPSQVGRCALDKDRDEQYRVARTSKGLGFRDKGRQNKYWGRCRGTSIGISSCTYLKYVDGGNRGVLKGLDELDGAHHLGDPGIGAAPRHVESGDASRKEASKQKHVDSHHTFC